MNILAIVGSFRKGSYNRIIFNHYRTMVSGQADITEGKHDDFPLYNEDVKEKGPPESVLKLAEQIRSAHGILIFSPEYNYSMPGLLKNTLDWMSRLPNQPFAGKPVSILSASPGKLGGARMQYHLRQVGVALDMNILNKPEVMISEVHKKLSPDGQITDTDTAKFLMTHFLAFKAFIE